MTNSSISSLIERISTNNDLWGMGHNQNHEDLDIGLGWLYYGITRSLRPSVVVIIGSWRGFVPLIIGQAIQENCSGKILFIDPSFVDDQWTNDVDAYFASYGVNCIHHYLMTSQEFIESPGFKDLVVVMLFIDGMHTYEQCKFEFESFSHLLSHDSVVLMHDSSSKIKSSMYGTENEYEHTVWKFLKELRQRNDFDIIEFPIDQGIAIIKPRIL